MGNSCFSGLATQHSSTSNQKRGKLTYVDEDAARYYDYTPGSSRVTAADESVVSVTEDERATVLWIAKGSPGFEDNKILLVQDPDSRAVLPPWDDVRKTLLQSDECARSYWFELACRLGKEISLDEWLSKKSELAKNGTKLVKIVGFDGGSEMECPCIELVSQELANYQMVIWDGDWYNEKGWTGLLPKFLEGDESRIVVAFQKKPEVPGFHRSYWHLYKRFPGRIWMVVMPETQSEELSDTLKQQLAWLDDQYRGSLLLKPSTWQGVGDRYVKLALQARELQGEEGHYAPVVSLNGGKIAAAQAAVETLMPGGPKIKWTVFPAEKPGKTQPENSTVMDFVRSRGAGLPLITLKGG